MTQRIEPRESKVPGERTVVRLDVAEQSLRVLLEGLDAVRCWLVDEGDGLYSFHATQTFGQSREQPGRPAADVLVTLLNEFSDCLNQPDVPEWVRKRWDKLAEEYAAETASATKPEA
jgi:hypothetical protein